MSSSTLTRLTRLTLVALASANLLVTAHAQNTSPTPATPVAIRTLGTPDFAQIVQRYGPAVVNISVSGTRLITADSKDSDTSAKGADSEDPTQLFLRKFQEQFGATGASMQIPVSGRASGFIVSADGLVLTNAHVIAHASEVTVKLTDRREFKAKVLGSDNKTDVAVLKIDAKNLPTVAIGQPGDLNVGEWVLAIGSPFGLDNTVTTGVVSAKSRTLPDDYTVPFIQTDAAINPGNSGGPLFNARGEVVGINSQIYTRSGGYQGLSFAIPIDLAQSVARQIVATGHASHGVLGVSVQEVTQALADAFKLPRPAGALISEVRADTAAAKAGLQAGDVIAGIDGHAILASSDLPLWVAMALPGQQMQIDVLRNGKAMQVRATLEDTATAKPAPHGVPNVPVLSQLGLAVRPLLPVEQRAAEARHGLMIEGVQPEADKAGIAPGDILLAINQVPVTSVEQARALLAQAKGSVALLVQHGAEKNYIAIPLKPGA
ncbi:Do family serine endopeptidase [Rhodoferax sp.]|uniref:Do family serine endopeptidase n=1 Tax=Rhodoferax sp. TaxID=50421 RepID=UPI002ACDDC77|nr:Do family serine endopeptidase [Rhodoferax sp.]MDZ7919401.1 Do family serine endopeptidase [Rhodoferax sp.]